MQGVHHACARHCEAIGDLKSAMQHYMASGTAATEVSTHGFASSVPNTLLT
jgi:hypothetical protein